MRGIANMGIISPVKTPCKCGGIGIFNSGLKAILRAIPSSTQWCFAKNASARLRYIPSER